MREIFKIIRIIDDKNIVINGGDDNCLSLGDILEVFVIGDEIKDLDTERTLGTLDIIKARLEVTALYEKMCLCQNADTVIRDIFSNPTNMKITSKLPLKVDMTQAQKLSTTSDKVLRVGDLVRKEL